jgi:hypothetical protein
MTSKTKTHTDDAAKEAATKAKEAEIAVLIQHSVDAQKHEESEEIYTNKAAHALVVVLGEKQPKQHTLDEFRKIYIEKFAAHYEKKDTEEGRPHFVKEIRKLQDGSIKTRTRTTDQYKGHEGNAKNRWTRMLKLLGWKSEAKRKGATPGRKPKTHACPHCSASVAFVKGVLEKAVSA